MDNQIRMNLLGDGPIHQEIARHLELGLTTRPDAAGTPLVVVAEQASDVQAILRARAWLPIAAIIAWRLPESALLRLLDLDVPVFVGLAGTCICSQQPWASRSTQKPSRSNDD